MLEPCKRIAAVVRELHMRKDHQIQSQALAVEQRYRERAITPSRSSR